MKKLMMALALCLLSASMYSQERTVAENKEFSGITEDVYSAVGWAYSSTTNSWVDYYNVIDNNDSRKNTSTAGGKYHKSVREQNFNSFQFRKLDCSGKTYYVLELSKVNGAYKYPNIKQDWFTYDITIFYVTDEDNYKAMFPEDKDVHQIQFSYDVSRIESSSENDNSIINKICNGVSRKQSDAFKSVMYVKQTDDGKYMRFTVPMSQYSSKSFDFSKKYFEIEIADWNSLNTWK